MAALGAAIHALLLLVAKAWMAGTEPGHDEKGDRKPHFCKRLASGRSRRAQLFR
jgi:hypothetical protein